MCIIQFFTLVCALICVLLILYEILCKLGSVENRQRNSQFGFRIRRGDYHLQQINQRSNL